ncbi:hypothetical protein [Cyclobacterium sp. SYSU L10401]|uniref:hypothetical protein n=1 Tax=Cyclobacterium sp. SYSU L10401 TaxID=2678657 RepID=UPI0013D7F938|nr:hypothetical protein [Cyclobacterium sp. SYSU L10401]
MDRDLLILKLKKDFRLLETKVLLLIAVPLPLFSFAYLYTSSGNLQFDLPVFPQIFSHLIFAVVISLLLFQYFAFQKKVGPIRNSQASLNEKVMCYGKATYARYWHLFWVGILSATGLFFFDNQVFTIAYALNLIFISLGKPTPDRIIRILKLKKEEKEMVYQINRREN